MRTALILSVVFCIAVPEVAQATPAPPTNLRATASTPSSVTLAWDASVGATSYAVSVDDGSSDIQIGTTTTLSFVADKHGASLTSLACGTSYWFGVRARDSSTFSARTWLFTSTAACGTPTPTCPVTNPSAGDPNQTVPTSAQLACWRTNAPSWLPADYRDKVTGDKTGTTREILTWAAAKWDIPTVYAFAQAWKESGWNQAENGDGGLSWGILQQKETSITGSYPMSKESVAFSADVGFAIVRAYADGALWTPADPTLISAYGAYYSGGYCPLRWVIGSTVFPPATPTCNDVGAAAYEQAILLNTATHPWPGG